MINNVKIEICIGNGEDGITAAKYPIDRLELNSALELGGLTPTVETLRYLKKRTDIKICSMVRCRGGNFCYSDSEYEIMFKDAENLLDEGSDGIVFGFLNEDSTINVEKTKEMVSLIHSYGREAVFHKAFDELDDQTEGCAALIELGVDRILTSGKAAYPDILEGCKRINILQNRFGRQIQLLPGGGVRIENIQDVIKTAGTSQVHMTSKKTCPGGYIGLDEDQLQLMLQKISELC